MGVGFNEFWTLTPAYLQCYYKAREMKLKEENTMLWLQGLYVYEAILRASPIFNPFAKTGTKPLPYLEKPYETKEEQKIEFTEEEQIKSLQLKTHLFLKNWARAVKRQER